MRIIDRKRQEFTIERIMIKLQTIKVCASSFGEGRCKWHFAVPQNVSLTLWNVCFVIRISELLFGFLRGYGDGAGKRNTRMVQKKNN